MHRRALLDYVPLWFAASGVLAVIGGIPLGPAIAEAVASQAINWNNPFIIGGLVIEAFALITFFYGLVLMTAHGHLEGEQCPDPSAHRLPAATSSAADPRQLRSVLRQMRDDLGFNIQQFELAIESGHLWRYSVSLKEGAWRKNRQQLDSLPGMGSLYDVLSNAFGHVARVRQFEVMRLWHRAATG
jgi:MFS family permease